MVGLSHADQVWGYIIAGRAAHLGGHEERSIGYYRAARLAARDLASPDERVAAWGELAVASDLELPEAPALLAELETSQLATPDDQLRLSCRSLVLGNRFGSLKPLDNAAAAAHLVAAVADPSLCTSFLNVYGYISAIAGEYEQATAVVDELSAYANRMKIAFVLPYCCLTRAVVACGLRQFEEALALLDEARINARRTGDAFVVASAGAIKARALISLGLFDEAASAASYDEGKVIRSMEAELIATRALARACGGRADEARDLARDARTLSRAVEVPVLTSAALCISDSLAGVHRRVSSGGRGDLTRDEVCRRANRCLSWVPRVGPGHCSGRRSPRLAPQPDGDVSGR